MVHIHDGDVERSYEWMQEAFSMREAMEEPLPMSAAAFYGNSCAREHAPPWLAEFDSQLTNQVTASGRVTAQATGAASRHLDAINTIRQQLRSDTSQNNRVRLGRNGFSDLSHNFIGLSMTAYKSKVVEVVNEQDLALIAKVQVSPFVRGGTTVVAAVVGQAPVPQQTRASRASTRAVARA